ncbi:MAG: glycosyltransferase family 2 protein [Kiritimatiellia bacterium]
MTVSVIVPAFNAERTIGAALASVAAQTWRDLELIMVDDASTDRTVEVARAALAAFEHAQLVCLKKNSGPARARNCGIARATREWVAFLDGDDEWLPDRLEIQLSLAQKHPEVPMFCSTTVEESEYLPPGKNRFALHKGTEVPTRLLRLADFKIVNPVVTSTVLVRKEVVQEFGGFDETLRGPEDFDLWMRIATKYPIVQIERGLAFYREAVGSLSNDDRNFLPQIMRLIEKAYGPQGVFASCGDKQRARAYHLLSCAWMAASRGARARALWLFGRSLACWPFSFRPTLDLPWGRARVLAYFVRKLSVRREASPRQAEATRAREQQA